MIPGFPDAVDTLGAAVCMVIPLKPLERENSSEQGVMSACRNPHLMSPTAVSLNFCAVMSTRSVCRVLLHDMQRAFAVTPAPEDSTFTMLCAAEPTHTVRCEQTL